MVLAANGHHGDSSDDEQERGNVIHIGSAYQATCPELISSCTPCPASVPEKALLVWKPEPHISDVSLENYITLAKEKYGYNGEQALGMLYWHGYDVEKAIHDLPNFTPLPDEWTVEDKVLFEQAFQFHGKNFTKIRQMLPDKTIPSLVKYYYSWKKAKNRVSLMDRQARRLRHDEPNDAGSGNATENESDLDEKDAACSHCGQSGGAQSGLVSSPKGSLCTDCNQNWKTTGMLPKTGSLSKHIVGQGGAANGLTGVDLKKQKKPPKGMYLNCQDLMAIATGPIGQGDSILKALDSELCSLKRQVQLNKADISKLREEAAKGIDDLRPPETGIVKANPRWTNEELALAVQGVRKYGTDFKAIAEVVGNKTEAHVKNFYAIHRERYKLDDILSEWEAERGISPRTNEKPETERNVPKVHEVAISSALSRSASPSIRNSNTTNSANVATAPGSPLASKASKLS
ncbi:REST corepressor 2-like isoform X1 [Varroa jacobsoni]|uniref:REST corepressor n=2 Tax=Varroa destructor TaxID=109461 RepID=A0A7M7JJM1_VARDE|nr:REST corepressor 2-like isoform X1 [Varroa destructor]XP_022693978.1 REST corepressor 2-like isoform X1 [Varroa jacobsoni]